MEFQIKEALRHGVNVFIYDWYWYDRRPFLEQCLDEGFLCAPNNGDMKFYLMWANHDAGYLWDKRQTDIDEIVIFVGGNDRNVFKMAVFKHCILYAESQRCSAADVLSTISARSILQSESQSDITM